MASVPSPLPSHATPLRLVQPASVDLARALPILVDQAPEWLGTPIPGVRPGSHRYLTDLSLPIREHSPSLTFKKAAYVDLGAVRSGQDICDIEIEWRSASLAPLFPVFAGHLTLTPMELRLEGYYAPPAGDLGAVLDRAFLNIAARGTARWFLGRAAEVLGTPPTKP
ncbi:MAG: hypothetical protein ACXWNI_00035 [Candidatus Limnocylindrales bacterium]